MENQEEKETINSKKETPKKKSNGLGCNIGCKFLSCIGCLLPVVLILLLLFTVISKPQFLWVPAKKILNHNLNSQDYQNIADAKEQVDLAAKIKHASFKNGTAKITITTKEFASLLKSKFSNPDRYYLNINSDRISILINIDQKDEPLWMYIDIQNNNNHFVLARSGFGLVQFPANLLNFIQQKLINNLSIINLNNASDILNKLMSIDNITIQKIDLEQDQITLTVNSN